MSPRFLRRRSRWTIPTSVLAFVLAIGLSLSASGGQSSAQAATATTATAAGAAGATVVQPVLSCSSVSSSINLLALSGANTSITSATSVAACEPPAHSPTASISAADTTATSGQRRERRGRSSEGKILKGYS